MHTHTHREREKDRHTYIHKEKNPVQSCKGSSEVNLRLLFFGLYFSILVIQGNLFSYNEQLKGISYDSGLTNCNESITALKERWLILIICC